MVGVSELQWLTDAATGKRFSAVDTPHGAVLVFESTMEHHMPVATRALTEDEVLGVANDRMALLGLGPGVKVDGA